MNKWYLYENSVCTVKVWVPCSCASQADSLCRAKLNTGSVIIPFKMEIVSDRQVPTWKTLHLFIQSFQQDPLLSFLRGRWCSFRWVKVCISIWSANAKYFSFCEVPNYTKICVLIDQYRTQENSNGLICPDLPFCESISLWCNSFSHIFSFNWRESSMRYTFLFPLYNWRKKGLRKSA